jgi:hypothetical protein
LSLLRVLPGATSVDRIGEETVVRLRQLRAVECAPETVTEVSIELQPGTRSVRLGDVLYGAARFAHSEHLAQHGLVAADAAAFFVSPKNDALVLAVGIGKSTLAVRAARLGMNVIADDVVLLEVASGSIRATSDCGGLIVARSGATANLGPRLVRSGTVTRTIVVQSAFGGAVARDRPDHVDLSSWLWQALSGRFLNTRAFPDVFRLPYLAQLSPACAESLSAVHRALATLPARRLLGNINNHSKRDLIEWES